MAGPRPAAAAVAAAAAALLAYLWAQWGGGGGPSSAGNLVRTTAAPAQIAWGYWDDDPVGGDVGGDNRGAAASLPGAEDGTRREQWQWQVNETRWQLTAAIGPADDQCRFVVHRGTCTRSSAWTRTAPVD